MKRLPLVAPALLLALGCSPSPAPAPAMPSPARATKPAQGDVKAPAPDRRLAFDVLAMGGKKTGESVVTIHPDGTRAATMEWNDRGRGPKLAMNLTLDAAGAPATLDVAGVDYYKAAVDEHLSNTAGKLAWKNRGEAGDGPSGTGAFYVAFHAPPEADAVLARALMKRPDHTLPLLPKGQARLEKGTDLTLTRGEEKIHVTRWDFLGVHLSPEPIWLDDDGELFGEVSEWFAVMRAGWSDKAPDLIAEQTAAESARLERDAKALTHAPPAAGLAIVNARIFDAEKKTTQLGTILVKGDRIVAVGPAKAVKIPAGAETLDAAGKTVLPGLWDMHAHVSPLDGTLDVAAGITTVRDLGNDVAVVNRLRDAWDAGKTVGPRVVAAGLIDGRGPFQAPTKVFADTEEEAKAQVDMYAAAGCVQIKIYSSIKPTLVPALVAAAHAKKMRVSGHVPSGMNATDAVNAGFDELQHMNFLFLNFLAKNDEDTRTPLRFTRVADKGSTIDPSQANVKDFIKLLVQKKIVVDATDNIFESMFTDRAGKVPEWATRIEGRLPVLTRRELLVGGLPLPDASADTRYKESFAAVLKMTKALFDAGVPLVAGTDAFPGFALHRELELYVKAGIPAADVLTLATLGAAKVMKKEKDLGSIAAGKYADLAIVDGKPDQDILDIERVTTTIKGGAVFATKDVYATIGIGP